MTTAHKITVIVAIIVLILAGCFAREWYLEREARATAETTATAAQKTISADATAIADRDKVSEATDQKIAQQTAAVTSLAAAVQVMQQHQPEVKIITVPGAPAGGNGPSQPATPAPAPPIETVQRADLPTAVQAKLPDAPSYAILTPDQAIACAKSELAGDVAANDAKTCKADLGDRTTQLAAKTTESNAWETAAKGGTKFHRFLNVGKLTGCAAAPAAGGAIADKSKPFRGAAIGAAIGVIGCSLILKF